MKLISEHGLQNAKPVDSSKDFQNFFEDFLTRVAGSSERAESCLSEQPKECNESFDNLAGEDKLKKGKPDCPSDSNCMEKTVIYINDSQVPPLIQNALTNDMDGLEDNSFYFIPANCIDSAEMESQKDEVSVKLMAPLAAGLQNGQATVELITPLAAESSEASRRNSTSSSETICQSSPITDDTNMEVCSGDEGLANDLPSSSENSVTNPKVVVQMTPTYTGHFPSIPSLGIESESEEDISEGSDASPTKASIPKPEGNTSVEVAAIESPCRVEESDDQRALSAASLSETTENRSGSKVRRRFRCLPSYKCEHKAGSTICSFKIEKPDYLTPRDAMPVTEVPNSLGCQTESLGPRGPSYDTWNEHYRKCRLNKLAGSNAIRIKKPRRKIDLDFDILPGKGERLGDIACIAQEVKETFPEQLSVLHKILFDLSVFGKSNRTSLKMRRNILNFSGFHFMKQSTLYKYKRLRLCRLREKALKMIGSVLFGCRFFSRLELIDMIMDFLMEPTDKKALDYRLKRKFEKEEELDRRETHELVTKILLGKTPAPTVLLKRLTAGEIEKHISPTNSNMSCNVSAPAFPVGMYNEPSTSSPHKRSFDSGEKANKRSRHVSCTSSEYPEYLDALIKESAAKCFNKEPPAKCFNKEPPAKCFNKEPPAQESEFRASQGFEGGISVLGTASSSTTAIQQMSSSPGNGKGSISKSFADVLSSLASTGNQMVNFVHLLLSTDNANASRVEFPSLLSHPQESVDGHKLLLERIEKNFQDICHVLKQYNVPKKSADQVARRLAESPSKRFSEREIPRFVPSALPEPTGRPLRSFDKICSNVECATPRDLSGLHDLIYSGPCDDVEIHERILDFSGFPFTEDSLDYRWRKTLLCHMRETAVQDIARLLDLTPSHQHTDQEELSSCILRFLMEPNNSDASCSKSPFRGKAHIVVLKSSESSENATLPYETPSSSSYHSQSPNEGPPSLEPYDAVVEREPSKKFSVAAGNQSGVKRSPSESSVAVQCPENFYESHEIMRWMTDSSWSSEERAENLPISAFFGHPSDKQLRRDIEEAISERSGDITMKGITEMVLSRYPQFDLRYRISFIKSEIRETLSTLKPGSNIFKCQPQNFNHCKSLISSPNEKCLPNLKDSRHVASVGAEEHTSGSVLFNSMQTEL